MSGPYSNDGGVNLAHLLVGSEGTLAFTKDLTLKLVPLPKNKGSGRGQFRQLPHRDGFSAAYRQARAPARWSWSTAS
jgi:FAD/FMN-containing dehydrogenase